LNNKIITEEEVKLRYITPAIVMASWNIETQVRMEYYFTDGRVKVNGSKTKRGKRKFADYILLCKPNIPLAIIEAKDSKHSVGAGMQQGLEYAEIISKAKMLDIPFVYSSNGDGFLEHDMQTGKEREISNDDFPTPDELWSRYKNIEKINEKQEELITEPYHYEYQGMKPRYYQRVAINRTVSAIAKGQQRILLVMATGTGKTYTAFQIIYRLWKSKTKKKILYLADRNVLVDQTITGDFKPFKKVMTKIEDRKMDSAYEIYLALYQQLTGEEDEEVFREFKPDFFDLIIIDECHRGSAREDSRWRKILGYFKNATHIGMTATPKETNEISNIDYFGEPIYTYSLKQGISDGFLAPYKVVRIGIDVDLLGYRPEEGKIDMYGNEIEDREYNSIDFDRKLIIDDRTAIVAKKVTEFLKKTDRFSKTIIFCVTIDHAERMRQALVNENSDLVKKNDKYIMRITGDNPEGKAQLDNFMDEECLYPTIVTTSKLMTTGVNCKTCKVIVLDNTFGDQGMTEFKQIIGRGTRIKEEYGKMFFTVLDFKNASRMFADPDFDGEPVQIFETTEDGEIVPPEEDDIIDEENGDIDDNDDADDWEGSDIVGGFEPSDRPVIYRVNDVKVKVLSKRVQYLDDDGKLITESIIDYTKRNILNQYSSLDSFLNAWNSEQRKKVIIEELNNQGVFWDELKEEIGQKNLDEFDLICHIAYDKKPLTKSERINNVKKRGYLYKYSDQAQKVLETLLDKYADLGIVEIEDLKILDQKEFVEAFGSPFNIVKLFGGKEKYIQAIKELEDELYVA
jgi:type I restriction enzyme, R subunit